MILGRNEEIDLDICYSDDPIDGISIIWEKYSCNTDKAGAKSCPRPREDPDCNTNTGAYLIFQERQADGIVTERKRRILPGQHLMQHTTIREDQSFFSVPSYSGGRGQGSSGRQEWHEWKLVTADHRGIIDIDEYDSSLCLGLDVNPKIDEDCTILTSDGSRYRRAKLRQFSTSFEILRYRKPFFEVIGEIGGLSHFLISLGGIIVSLQLLLCRASSALKSEERQSSQNVASNDIEVELPVVETQAYTDAYQNPMKQN